MRIWLFFFFVNIDQLCQCYSLVKLKSGKLLELAFFCSGKVLFMSFSSDISKSQKDIKKWDKGRMS